MQFIRKIRQYMGFAREDLPDQPTTEELASRRVQQVAGLMQWLPNPDRILQKTGKRIEHLRNLTADDEVFSAQEWLFGAVRDVEWDLEHDGSNEAAVEVVQSVIDGLDWDRIDSEVIDARLYGYQPMEVMWADTGGYWLPLDVVGKPPEWFGYNRKNELGLRTQKRTEDYQVVPPEKFICIRHRPSFLNPYGESALSRCFWPVTFKKGDLRFWITFAEKYGMPHAVGKHPRGAQNEEIEELLDSLASMVQDAVAAVPDDSSVELLESPFKSASSGVYEAIIKYCERSIQKVIVSSEMVTSAGEYGTQALGESQIEEVAGKVISGLLRMKRSLVNELIDLIWHFNFAGQDGKPTYEIKDEPDASKEKAERDEKLVGQGVRFTASYYQREYNLSEDDFELSEPQSPAAEGRAPAGAAQAGGAPAFSSFADARAAGGQAAVDELVASITAGDEDNQAAMETLLEPVMEQVMNGDSAEAVMMSLAQAYPDLDGAALEERMRSLFFVADVWGRLSEEQDATE